VVSVVNKYSLSDTSILDTGAESVVHVLPEQGEVVKIYNEKEGKDVENTARNEYRELENVNRVFGRLSGLQTPTPLELYTNPSAIRMTRCNGEQLLLCLIHRKLSMDTRLVVGRLLATGISAYVDLFDLGLPDCTLSNIVYDEQGHIVSFIDFSPALSRTQKDRFQNPVSFSLGTLIGTTLYELCRPSRIRYIRAWTSMLNLISIVSARVLSSSSHEMDSEKTHRIARTVFTLCSSQGSLFRKTWYRILGGPALFICKRAVYKAIISVNNESIDRPARHPRNRDWWIPSEHLTKYRSEFSVSPNT
jgi:tRNA A-37 threonylcarbamoyl transferase component Bud32